VIRIGLHVKFDYSLYPHLCMGTQYVCGCAATELDRVGSSGYRLVASHYDAASTAADDHPGFTCRRRRELVRP